MEKSPSSQQYTHFLQQLETQEKLEEKVRLCLEFMRLCLSQEKKPAFRDFWGAKQRCLELFKEKIASKVHSLFWNEYLELSKQMKSLQVILNEEATFAQEQIELGMKALEQELMDGQYVLVKHLSSDESQVLKKNGPLYRQLQGEVDRFHSFAQKLTGLRKEILGLHMRLGAKNRLLDRLNRLGDQVFPKRKEMIQQLSALFTEDVDQFVSKHFSLEQPPYFALKDEIKKLQDFAKQISIRSDTFKEVRNKLSHCWEQVKEKEQLHRQAKAAKNEQMQAHFTQIAAFIDSLQKACEEGSLSLAEVGQREQEVLRQMQELKLRKEDVQIFKKRLEDVKKHLVVKKELQTKQEKKAIDKLAKDKAEKTRLFFEHLDQELQLLDSQSEEMLGMRMALLYSQKNELSLTERGASLANTRLSLFADRMAELQWKRWNTEMPSDFVERAQSLLEESKTQRLQLKAALDKHRKAYGLSGLSLEESLDYTDLIEEEKQRLLQLEALIEEIEMKLWTLEE